MLFIDTATDTEDSKENTDIVVLTIHNEVEN
jgi:hypothetical protein